MVSDKIFNKTIKPYKFTFGAISIDVSSWTELTIKFVRWLIEEKYLKQENLPITNHAERGKYFINSKPVHQYAEKKRSWHKINNYHIDTKYNAEDHIKNIISALNQLGIYNPDIKVSFRHD